MKSECATCQQNWAKIIDGYHNLAEAIGHSAAAGEQLGAALRALAETRFDITGMRNRISITAGAVAAASVLASSKSGKEQDAAAKELRAIVGDSAESWQAAFTGGTSLLFPSKNKAFWKRIDAEMAAEDKANRKNLEDDERRPLEQSSLKALIDGNELDAKMREEQNRNEADIKDRVDRQFAHDSEKSERDAEREDDRLWKAQENRMYRDTAAGARNIRSQDAYDRAIDNMRIEEPQGGGSYARIGGQFGFAQGNMQEERNRAVLTKMGEILDAAQRIAKGVEE